MRNLLTFFILFFLTNIVVNGQSLSQTVISTQGNYNQVDQMAITWTLGETFIETTSSNSMVFTEGFNQPDLSVIENTRDNSTGTNSPINGYAYGKKSQIEMVAYPNPFEDELTITLSEKLKDEIEVRLMNSNGMVLRKATVSPDNRTLTLQVSDLPGAIYFLDIQASRYTEAEVYRVFKFY